MRRLALFDFCETLVSFQTADAFVDFVRSKNGNVYMKTLNLFLSVLSVTRVITLLNKLFPSAGIEKRISLLQLRGFTIDELNKLAELFYHEMIKPSIISPVLTEMKRCLNQDFEVCLVSAGYSIYLNYFAKEYQIQHVIATEIAFGKAGKRCKGSILGKDCFHGEKVCRLKTNFAGQNVSYDESISYSDSITDLPMLQMTGNGIVVSPNKSQEWCRQYSFEEIIWKKK